MRTLIGGTRAVVGFRETLLRPSRLAIIESPIEVLLLLAAMSALVDLERAAPGISLTPKAVEEDLGSSTTPGRWVGTGGECCERDLPTDAGSLEELGSCEIGRRRGEERVTEIEVGRLAGMEGILSMGNGRGFSRTCCCSFVNEDRPVWATLGVTGAVLGLGVGATE
jgi:hypothetical protein